MSPCALSLGYGHLKAQKTKCHNKTCAFEQRRSIPAKTRGETVKRSYLLVLHQGLKQLHSKRATNWNRKKWKAWSRKVALQDPASTAENSHRDYLHRCHAGFRSFLSASSNCHPAKRKVLTPPRARKHNAISRQVPSSLATDWQHRKGSPLAGYICQSWTLQWSTLPFSQWPDSQNSCPHSLFETNIALSTRRLSGRQHWLVLDR